MTYTVTTTSTADVPPRDRLDFWAAHVESNNGRLRSHFDSGDFAGSTVVQRAGEHQLLDFTSDRIGYSRTARDLADGDGTRALLVPLRGALRFAQAGLELAARPGQALVVTKQLPFELAHPEGVRALVLRLPDASPPDRPALLGSGLAGVVARMVREIARQRDRLDAPSYVAASLAAASLVASALPPADTRRLAEVGRAARRHVREYAADPALTPESLARAVGWSLRQVQLALRAEGTTPATLIRDARLELARAAVLTTATPVSDIAYAAGFTSLSSFGAAFRERFAASPRELRRRGRS